VALGVEAEKAGWDGLFVWEGVYGQDAWTTLGAIAARTERIRLGTMLTPLPRRRPWKLASEVVTLDHLSDGRAILAVGLGAYDPVLGLTGEKGTRRSRAERLDEGLAVVTGLWSGERVQFDGKHYRVDIPAGPTPLQADGIPIWVVGVWGRPASIGRAVRYAGVLPAAIGDDGGIGQASPADVAEIAAFATTERDGEPFDIVVEGETPRDDLGPWREAGATWWLETRWEKGDEFGPRVAQGPPPAI